VQLALVAARVDDGHVAALVRGGLRLAQVSCGVWGARGGGVGRGCRRGRLWCCGQGRCHCRRAPVWAVARTAKPWHPPPPYKTPHTHPASPAA
jgi:hypothetical protein